jgi:RNA recognition motif-containing protein
MDRPRPGLGMQERPQRPGEELPDNCKLFVAGMPPAFDDDALRAVFSPFGPVLHAAVIKDQVTGLPKYGFVHFPDASSAQAAADGMNGKIIAEEEGARPLTVKLRSDRHQPSQGGMLHSFDESKLYVCHLPESATEEGIRGLFGSVAPVLQVRGQPVLLNFRSSSPENCRIVGAILCGNQAVAV